jgi:hypothetical protein
MLAQAGLFSKKKETEDQHASSRMVQVWPPGPKVFTICRSRSLLLLCRRQGQNWHHSHLLPPSSTTSRTYLTWLYWPFWKFEGELNLLWKVWGWVWLFCLHLSIYLVLAGLWRVPAFGWASLPCMDSAQYKMGEVWAKNDGILKREKHCSLK